MTSTAQPARPWVVFADDWGRHPSSCQHLIRHVLSGRPVVWVNTIGTRPPRFDWSTAKRVAGKLREWVTPSTAREATHASGTRPVTPSTAREATHASGTRQGAEHPQRKHGTDTDALGTQELGTQELGTQELGTQELGTLTSAVRQELGTLTSAVRPVVVAPKMWPSFRSGFGRRLNCSLLSRALRPIFEALPQPPDVVTTLPLVADLVGRLPVRRWVYYCVDDFSVWPGYDGATMLRLEREFVPKVDAVIAVSDTLVRHIAGFGKHAHLLTHGVDLDHWRAPPDGPVPEFAGLTPPFVVFWGVIDRRTDLAFLRHLTANLTTGTVVLVGPQEDPDPEVFRLPRLAIRPPVPFDRLPALASSAAVLVMPYIDAPVTHAMQPLKLKEYMATGRPVVVRGLPATRPWADAVDVADSPEEFTARVQQRLNGITPAEQHTARQRLTVEGWAGKAAAMEKFVNGDESSPPGEIRATVD